MDEICVICKRPLSEQSVVKLGKKGSESVNRTSVTRGTGIRTEDGQNIHSDCFKNYTHERNCKQNTDNNNSSCSKNVTLRSTVQFDFKTKCIFCSTEAKINNKKRGHDVYPVRMLEFQDMTKKLCFERNDDWSNAVLGRISSVIDLPAAEARYHQTCNVNFRTHRQLPKQYRAAGIKSPGRPEKATDAFNYVVKYIEGNAIGQTLTVSDVVEVMTQKYDESTAYSVKHMKRKLQDYFGDALTFSSLDGKHDIITLKETTATIIHTFAKTEGNKTDESEKMRIITTAAKLIKTDINAVKAQKQVYPSSDVVASLDENLKYVPESLQTLLYTLFSSKDSKNKIGSIGQAVMQVSRPRGIIAPLQIGLGVQMHRQFGSHFLVDTLHRLGFCSSYSEIQRFEMNSAKTLNCTINSFFPGKFLQFVSDNVDHNIGTLDGNDTYHGMGTIACVTPGSKAITPIPRGDITTDEVADIGRINIKFFTHKEHDPIIFHKLAKQTEDTQPIDLFCKLLWPVVPSRPTWSGFMQLYDRPTEPHYPGVSTISFLPMIDLNPSDLNCVFTTMCFVCDLARTYGVTPVLTFDQPLFTKATYIANCERNTLKEIVLRLGAFHTQMSFLGSIGHLMAGSGLQELLETAYAKNAVTHMLSGKAVSRAVRGHFLVDTALHALLIKQTFGLQHPKLIEKGEEAIVNEQGNKPNEMHGVNSEIEAANIATNVTEEAVSMDAIVNVRETEPREFLEKITGEINVTVGHTNVGTGQTTGDNETNCEAKTLTELLTKSYQKLSQKQIGIQRISGDPKLDELYTDIQEAKSNIRKQNRTGSLWIQYMEMISILQDFIRAERTGNWALHLTSLQRMLPFFAASGHNLYLKSAYTYLQNMRELPDKYPDVHKSFLEGSHVIRRSDRYWGGLSTDLTIEQVLMRSLKTSGGLTRGRGMTESQRSLWLLSMPATAEMNAAMQTYTETEFQTSEQHKDGQKARINRDEKDTLGCIEFLTDHNPFDESHTSSLRNIETGVTSGPAVNADNAALIGAQILDDMVGQSLTDYTFKRSKQAITMAESSSVTVKGESLSIDPQVLFQRLLAVARYADELPEVFKYELSSVPSSLFDNHGLLRESQKSILADSIWKSGNFNPDEGVLDRCDIIYIVDGGSFLQKLPWQKGTFREICEQYHEYLSRRYSCAVVVFDGYATGPTTKDTAHIRRTKGVMGPKVVFDLATPFKGKKETFLRNVKNKQRFIEMLGHYLTQHGIHVRYAESDADVLIVRTAVEYATTKTVVVVGEDTDLLVLLCYYVDLQQNKIIFRSDTTRNLNRRVWDIHKTKVALGEIVCALLPFVHALSGCDTTSRIFGVGKAAALKLLRTNRDFQQIVMQCTTANSEEEILQYGKQCIAKMYDVSSGNYMSLDTLRYQKFASKVIAATSCIQVHVLPPTSDAASYHIRRVYLQTQIWHGNESLNPCDWGWEMRDDRLMPIKTKLPPAPEELLKIIRCNCKANCDTKRCSCRKHGLECSVGCGECRGVGCTNSNVMQEFQNETDDDEGDSNIVS